MRFFVGTYTRMGGPGIVLCTLEKGAMHVLSVAPELENPTYVILSANRRRLYAVSSGAYAGEEGSVASYDLEGDQWMLRTRQGTAGKSPCHLTCSPDERFLYEANYLTGNLSVYPLTAAGIGPRIQCIQHEGKGLNPTRQECAHLHQATFTPGHPTQLQAVDLGIDA
ncbi:MAG: beta-propeller fold lactonase family protein, partial [Clostridia bacterium]